MKLDDIIEEIVSHIDEVEVDPSVIELSPPTEEKIVKYKFNVDAREYLCEFRLSVLQDKKTSVLEVKFRLMNNIKSPKRKEFPSEESYQVALNHSQVGITGTGKAYTVFGKVGSALKKYTEIYHPDYITFTGDDKHSKLYEFFIKKEGSKFPEYEECKHDPRTNGIIPPGEFWIKRK